MEAPRSVSLENARRLAVARQALAGPRRPTDAEGILSVVRDLGCIQIDPMMTVDRSHRLVLWSRLGAYDPALLDRLLWTDRRLFEDWAHCMSIVLMEDYPVFAKLRRDAVRDPSIPRARAQSWATENLGLRRHILARIRRDGPLALRDFEDRSVTTWHSDGWTAGRNVERMLGTLWVEGRIMVSSRENGQKRWDLTERVLPPWAPRKRLGARELVRQAAQRSLRALGVAEAGHIRQCYIRGSYPDLHRVLARLTREGEIEPVKISDDGTSWPGTWYVHRQDLPLLDRIEAGDWEPRTVLLSPFDNLLCDRRRAERLFEFRYRMEIYTPRTQRRFGYYVMPILDGDRLIGRIDPLMDRKQARLCVHAVHAEPGTPCTSEAGQRVAQAIHELADFLGAEETTFTKRVPAAWRRALR